MTLAKRALEIAVSQLGKHEDPLGSNWGSPVREYLQSVGIYFPAAWCFAFVYWCYEEAAHELKVANPLPRTGGVLMAWRMAKDHRVLGGPMPGDIGIMDHGKGLGHAFMIESSTDGHNVKTIEGNTNNNGSREGVDVERKTRPRLTILGYLRFP